ncbi:MAG: hypothetical protein KAW47_03030 [Thermoplasmatales archaeon]|nr:hypothetical protein [Thermoplasmatales archaeon]
MNSKEMRRVLAKLNDLVRYIEELEAMLLPKEDYLLDLVKRTKIVLQIVMSQVLNKGLPRKCLDLGS